MATASLMAARLRELFSYDPETGLLTRLQTRKPGRWLAGQVAGGKCLGYIHVNVDGQKLKAHRIAFVLMTGDWPKGHVDHINGDRSDNRWANLRDGDFYLNAQNKKRPNRNNTTGFRGVHKDGNAYRPKLTANGIKLKNLGRFETAEEASATYEAARLALHPGYVP